MRKWTDGEVDFLLTNYRLMSYKNIASVLGRTLGSVKRRCHWYGLVKEGGSVRHPDGVTKFLLANYDKMPSRELAAAVGISPRAVDRFMVRRRLRRRVNGKMVWGSRGIRDDRAQVITRDGHKCVVCDYRGDLDVHHIDHNRRNNKTENLITLCPNHHREAHLGLVSFFSAGKVTTLAPVKRKRIPVLPPHDLSDGIGGE